MKKETINGYTIKLTEADDMDMADAYLDAMKNGEDIEECYIIHIFQNGQIIAFRELDERIHALRTFTKLTRDASYFSEFLKKYSIAKEIIA